MGTKRVKKRLWRENPRVTVVLGFLVFCVAVVIGRLSFWQVVDRSEQLSQQIDQAVEETTVKATRGNIYDRNGNTLVKDAKAKSVTVIPKQVEDPKAVAKLASSTFGLDYNEVLSTCNQLEDDQIEISDTVKDTSFMENLDPDAYYVEGNKLFVFPDRVKDAKKDAAVLSVALEYSEETVLEYLTSKENTSQTLKTKVDTTQAESFRDKLAIKDEEGEIVSYNGVELLDDQKRYYTNGNFLSYVLGFTGNNHEGLYGVEKTFDDRLKGTDGISYSQKDAQGEILPSETQLVREPVAGEDLYLSIDSNIQALAERGLENCVNTWEAKKGIAIIMNVKTGEIISMASKPDFDLNDPYKLSETFLARSPELESMDKAAALEETWKNPAVSFIYEPGSTFKPVTVSTALEEGVINPSMHFECVGAINVAGTTIHCTGTHGTQSLAEVLENSCNPGLVQIIQNVDPNTFYKYVYNLGFGRSTGIELTGEEEGIVNRVFQDDGSYNIIDYSTFSFGQGLAVTPIQIVTALNCLINNGYYVKPTILNGGGSESSKQIISNSTSSTLREEMKGVLESKTGLIPYTGGIEMGGKTGTAEKFVGGEYSSSLYVTSFFCFAPVDDPQYCCMVILDEPKNGAQGATSAAPTAVDLLRQTMIYQGTNPEAKQQSAVQIPECVGQSLEDAEAVLKERGINYTTEGQGETVLTQSLPAQSEYTGQTLVLTVGEKTSEAVMPDFNGMSVQSVNQKAKELGVKLEIDGDGFAYEQSVAPGTAVEPDQKITVKFKN